MNSFSHSGSTGDVFSSLALVRSVGRGEYYLKLHNMDNVAGRIGWSAGRHSGRMTQKDFDFLEPIMSIQSCLDKFEVWKNQEITHELENVVYHMNDPIWPRNFANQYANALRVDMVANFRQLQIDPYVEVDKTTVIPGRPVCISRNPYYLEGIDDITQVPEWTNWIERRLAEQSFFVGLPEDHAWFENTMKVNVQYVPTTDGLELARLISGAKMMIANQSMPGTLALGIGTTLWLETRKNTTIENNEILYPYRSNITYF